MIGKQGNQNQAEKNASESRAESLDGERPSRGRQSWRSQSLRAEGEEKSTEHIKGKQKEDYHEKLNIIRYQFAGGEAEEERHIAGERRSQVSEYPVKREQEV
jgi:hypothetical protein